MIKVSPNIQSIDLALIRDSPLYSATSDIKFSFVNQVTEEVQELHAHKLVLALGSEVFMAQFYGHVRENRDTINVEDASYEAFQILLDLLYNKAVNFETLNYNLLAEMFYLAKKFLLKGMEDSIIQVVHSKRILAGNLLDAAKVAEDKIHLERFSETLYKVCVKFVKDDINRFFEVCENNTPGLGGVNSIIVHKLMAKANRIDMDTDFLPVSICGNCKNFPCLHGQEVTTDNFVFFDDNCFHLPVKEVRYVEVILVYLDCYKIPTIFSLPVPKTGTIGDLCTVMGKYVNVPAESLVVTDVYNHRFHKIYKEEQLLNNILDRDDIFIYETENSDPKKVAVAVYCREKRDVSSGPTNLFGLPMLCSLPRSCTFPQLYEALLQRMARYVSRPPPAEHPLFSIVFVNSYGNAQLDEVSDKPGEMVTLASDNFIGLNWQPRAKEEFFSENMADINTFREDASMRNLVTWQPNVDASNFKFKCN